MAERPVAQPSEEARPLRFRTLDGVVEGTPEEIASLLLALREASGVGARPGPADAVAVAAEGGASAHGSAPPPPPQAPTDRETVIPSGPAPAPPPRGGGAASRPSNEDLLRDWSLEPGLSVGTRQAYVASAERFAAVLGGRSLIEATPDDVRAFERALSEGCRFRQWCSLGGRGAAPRTRVRCTRGLYAWEREAPASCNPGCSLFAAQLEGPRSNLNRLSQFYEHLRERGFVSANPADTVARRHARRLARPPGKRKRAPAVDEVRAVLRALLARDLVRETALVLALAKWGRRPDHVLLLDAGDLRGVDAPDPSGCAFADFAGPRDRREVLNRAPRTKLRGNLVAPVDAEFRGFLAERYLPWRERRWGFSVGAGPLFPTAYGARPVGRENVQRTCLTPALRALAGAAATDAEREAWEDLARPRSPGRMSPGTLRHYATTAWEDLGLDRETRMTLRGDVVPGALEAYRHLSPERVCARYRAHRLLPPYDGPVLEGAPGA